MNHRTRRNVDLTWLQPQKPKRTRVPGAHKLNLATENRVGHRAYETPTATARLIKMAGRFIGQPDFYDLTQKAAVKAQKRAHVVDEPYRHDLSAQVNEFITAAVEVAEGPEPRDLLRIAAWVRNELNIRAAAHILLAVAASREATKPFVREFCPQICVRPDDVRQVLGTYQYLYQYGTSIPFCLKRGLADATAHFSAFQMLKSNDDRPPTWGTVFQLIDRAANYPVVRPLRDYMTSGSQEVRKAHERGNYDLGNEQVVEALSIIGKRVDLASRSQGYLSHVTTGLLRTELNDAAYTWNNATSQFGSSKKVWEAILPLMPEFAVLRNLRNLADSGISLEGQQTAINTILKGAGRNRILPFRYYHAYMALKGDQRRLSARSINARTAFMEALEQAMITAIGQMPVLKGHTTFIVDHSGSMNQPISEKSKATRKEIATILGLMGVQNAENATMILFGADFLSVRELYRGRFFPNLDKVAQYRVNAMYTHLHKVLEFMHGRGIRTDRFVILSDEQVYATTFSGKNVTDRAHTKYRAQVNPVVYTHSIDLSGESTTLFDTQDDRVNAVSGFSERLFTHIHEFEGVIPSTTLDQIRQQYP